MIIAQISDTHIDPAHENGPTRLGDLEAVVDDINALDPAPDVVVHTGDLAHNGDDEKYSLAFAILEKLKAPLLICAGNRDERTLVRERLNVEHPLDPSSPYLQYSVDDFPIRIVVLDTLSDQSNQGRFCQDRTDILTASLSSDKSKPTVLFMHHPPFEVVESKYPHQFDPWEDAARLTSALDGQSHVVRGFCGHAHRHTTGTVAGIPFSTVPSIARDLRLGEFAPEVADLPLYHLHTFDEQFSVTTEIRGARDRRAAALNSAAD